MVTQITLAHDDAHRLPAFYGIKRINRNRFRLINRLGITYFILCTVLGYLVDVLFLLKQNYQDPETERYAFYVSTFLTAQVVCHYLLMRFTARWDNVKLSRTFNYQLPSNAGGPWRSCHDCGRTCPPRSYHCPVCRCCVLKRDHHCFLTGVCVGYHNQRHFIILSFYSTICSIIFMRHLHTYFLSQNFNMLTKDVKKLFLPITLFEYFTNSLGSDIILLTLVLYVYISCTLACSITLLQQVYLTLTGRTAYEVKSGKSDYSQTILNNFWSVFGKTGIILFLVPFPAPYHNDGFSWKYKYKSKIGP